MCKFAFLILLIATTSTIFSQTDSVKIDCADFELRIENAFVNKGSSYEQYEAMVLNSLTEGSKKQYKLDQLAKNLSESTKIEYTFEAESFDRKNSSLFRQSYQDEFGPIFELSEYESKYSGPFWFWTISWEYLRFHTIDVKSYATVIHELSEDDFLDMSLICNQKVFILMLGKILGDQTKSTERLDFYEKSEPLLVDFFKSANVNLAEFEKDFLTYLHNYEFTDSTIENQYLAYHFHTSDLVFMPLPQNQELRDKFREYHRKLFTQEAFYIDSNKIVERPESWDSLSLLRDIMRAYPDSIMFAPGKSPFELKVQQLVEQKNVKSEWFLTVYAGIFKADHHDLHKRIIRYSPIDFRSTAFRKWYALFVLQEMFNPDNIKPGIAQIENSYRAYAGYNEEIDNYFTFFLFSDPSLKTQIIKPYYAHTREQTFNPRNYNLEIFDNSLFADVTNGFRIQLKLDPTGNFIKPATIIEPPMSAAQEKLLLDALSKYKFYPFLIKYPDSTGFGWIQITCKKRTESEENSGWGDVDISSIEEIADDVEGEFIEEEEIFSFTETEAQFMHGQEGLEKFIQSRIPNELKTSERGTVYVRFIVNTDGSLEGYRVLKGINDELDAIAKNIAIAMPNWIPAEMDKKPVRSYQTLVVKFK